MRVSIASQDCARGHARKGAFVMTWFGAEMEALLGWPCKALGNICTIR